MICGRLMGNEKFCEMTSVPTTAPLPVDVSEPSSWSPT